jgi:hypothetical protein
MILALIFLAPELCMGFDHSSFQLDFYQATASAFIDQPILFDLLR